GHIPVSRSQHDALLLTPHTGQNEQNTDIPTSHPALIHGSTSRIKAIVFPDGVRDHKSPEAAIAWNQWRHCGRDAALASGVGLGTLLAILLFGSFGTRRGPEGVVALLFLLPSIVGFLTGSILGILAPPGSRERITMFLATSPLSDARLARGLLWNAWRTTLIAWGLVVIFGLLALGAAIVRGGGSSLQVQIDQLTRSSHHSFGVMILPLAVLASGVLAWTLTATFAVLHWTGNHLLPLFAIVSVLAVVMGLSMLSFFVDAETLTLLNEWAMMVGAAAIVAGSLLAFWTSFQQKMIEPGSATLLLSFWVVESLLCWFIVPAPPLYRLFVIGVLMLSVSPVAFAPLAISRNRHVA
ncbi:MAG: MFS family permease, partial [Planctomycetaceae bacterium]